GLCPRACGAARRQVRTGEPAGGGGPTRMAATGAGGGGGGHAAVLDLVDPGPPAAAPGGRDRRRGGWAGGRRAVACPAAAGAGVVPGRGATAPGADQQPPGRPDQLRRRGQVPVSGWHWPAGWFW